MLCCVRLYYDMLCYAMICYAIIFGFSFFSAEMDLFLKFLTLDLEFLTFISNHELSIQTCPLQTTVLTLLLCYAMLYYVRLYYDMLCYAVQCYIR